MIVFDLKCSTNGHVFEAWFGSSSDFEDQKARRLLVCPICGDASVSKALMTPNIPAKSNRKRAKDETTVPISRPSEYKSDAASKALLEAMAKAQSKILEKSEWVGRDFDSQARAMDAGEIDHASIHGEVTPDEAKSLLEDGIGVMPLPFPVIPPQKRN